MASIHKGVQAMIEIPEEVNHILNIVKAKYNLKDKSEAITKVVMDYGIELLEPELKPEFIEKMRIVRKEKGIKFKNIEELRRMTGG
ncbi:MAG: DUF2683 family protein [Nanoarchaeota archaeon]